MKEVLDLISRGSSRIDMLDLNSFIFELLDNMPFPIMLKDVENGFRYILWNKQCDLLSGFNRLEILGKDDFDIFGEEYGRNARKRDEELLVTGERFRVQEEYKLRNGEIRNTMLEKSVVQVGGHRFILVVRWDLTEEVTIQKEVQRINKENLVLIERNDLILRNANIGLVYLTPDYMVQWENLSSYSDNPLTRNYKPGMLCYNSRGYSEPCPGCVVAKTLASGQIERKIASFFGSLTVEITASSVKDKENNICGVVLKFDDISEKMHKDEELRCALYKAEESNRLKSAFLANMSHEIRTPLNAIIGFSQVLAEAEDAAEREQYAKIITENNDLLLQLINDILDLSKIESDMLKFVYGSVDLNHLMRNIESAMRMKGQDNQQVTINFEKQLPECIITTDSMRLQQVINNLMNNAMKFTEKGSICFGYEPYGENMLRFNVTDTGIGVPENMREAIFNRFTKLNTFKSGTGLGLAICRTIVQKLGGEIGVVPNEGPGSTFWFTISTCPSQS